ncbi:hypothetical protein PU630_15485 [Microbacterium horticulturae]|uniref:Uncharacterized protein n=1 Tax=Microbacterium horticulturae TaxID=3028316 RepID=A0ABY8BYT8_9MICO|nr:hypothetical protein [Microbacterium sp. KACC 23027]WEG08627.1 hypothetical protein PU630_15485 [Microbacterium sp. KACC 23027]
MAGWTRESSDPEPLVDGASELDVSQGRHRQVSVRSIGNDAFEVVSTDQVPDDPTEWTTAIRVVADEDGVHTLVELSMSSDDLARRVSVGRPKIVRDLLGAVERPYLGGSGVPTEPLSVPAAGIAILTEMLAKPARTLPIIVCAEPNGEHDGSWLRVAGAIAARAEGIAAVVTLDRTAVAAFRREYEALAIWDGGVRVYAPGIVDRDADGWRHRYYLRSRFEESPRATIDRIVYSVAQLSTRRRVPGVFRAFGEQGGLPADALDGMIPAKEFADAHEQWEFELDVARDEQSSLEKELASANGHLARLKDALIGRGLADLLWGTQHEEAASIPDSVQDSSEAVLAAQMYLSEWLVLPDSAIRELDDIDTAPEAYNWGNKTWRGLRALAAYAQDRAAGWDKGGFWEWCASGPALGWPATSKKLSMTESEGVQTGGKFKGTRVFKVDAAVDTSGEITMLAHLKISEGGGNLAPRVYFYDDTSGPTGKVHVGLVGPHHLVPNKSTN